MHQQICQEKLIEIFIAVDDFVKPFQQWLTSRALPNQSRPTRRPELTASEIITLLVYYHYLGYKNFHRAACAVLLLALGLIADGHLFPQSGQQ